MKSRRPSRTSRVPPAVIVLAAALLFAAAGPLRASDCSIDGGRGLILVRSADLRTRGVLAVSLAGRYYESLDLARPLGSGVGRYAGLCLAGDYGLSNWLEVSVRLPLWTASWETPTGTERVTGLAGPVLGAKFALPLGSSSFALAVDGRVALPVDREMSVIDTAGASILVGGGPGGDAEVMLLATADFTKHVPLKLHANVGWAFHANEDRGHRLYPDYYPAVPEGGKGGDNDALLVRGAVEFPGRRVDLFTEFRGDIIRDRGLVGLKENVITVTPGVRARFGDGWSVTGGFSVAISGDDRDTRPFDPHEAYPDWEATLAVSYGWPVHAADTDGDGIPDFRDRCVRRAEDQDGYQDADGCPDPDNDGDGIPDEIDGAPLLPEDTDGFEDADGVPDLDNDGDGIVDERDMCPDEREDLDGFEDEDGCPDR